MRPSTIKYCGIGRRLFIDLSSIVLAGYVVAPLTIKSNHKVTWSVPSIYQRPQWTLSMHILSNKQRESHILIKFNGYTITIYSCYLYHGLGTVWFGSVVINLGRVVRLGWARGPSAAAYFQNSQDHYFRISLCYPNTICPCYLYRWVRPLLRGVVEVSW